MGQASRPPTVGRRRSGHLRSRGDDLSVLTETHRFGSAPASHERHRHQAAGTEGRIGLPRGKEAPHGEVAIQRPNDDDPPIGGDTHIGDVLGMSVVEAPEHLPVRAERRIEFTGGERVSSPRRRGPPSGPRNSIATAVPSGIRSIADRKVTVTRPVATPRASTVPASERVRSRTRGRLIAMKTIAPP
jgi:hypothetical protein